MTVRRSMTLRMRTFAERSICLPQLRQGAPDSSGNFRRDKYETAAIRRRAGVVPLHEIRLVLEGVSFLTLLMLS